MHKRLVDSYQRAKKFAEDDYDMIRVRPERIPSGAFWKLHVRRVGPFKILKKVGPHAYVIDLSLEYWISSTFNVSDLIKFKEPAMKPNDPFEPTFFESEPHLECPQALVKEWHDEIDRILNEQIRSTRDRDYYRYLVHWQGNPKFEDF